MLDLIPQPQRVTMPDLPGFTVPAVLRVRVREDWAHALRPLARRLQDGAGVLVEFCGADADPAHVVVEPVEGTPQDGYLLRIDDAGIRIEASDVGGVRAAAQTVLGLAPVGILRAGGAASGFELPALEIRDRPAFGWRGLMIDVSRHFLPKAWILRLVEVMAFHKLNVLHLHLTDDQGWRIQIDAYPRLTTVGAFRRETLVGGRFSEEYDGVPSGGFYSKADLREIVAHAAAHGITVVPEIDVPGHMLAAIASYPEWGNTGEQLEVLTRWALSHNVMNVEEPTLQAIERILDEVIEIFPSTFIHLGGDECPRAEWRESPRVAAFMEAEGIRDLDGVQAWIMRRLAAHLRSRGRRALCWDEALDEDLADDVGVMAWRSERDAERALELGHPTVLSNQEFFYFDFKQSFDPAEPLGPDPDDFFMTTLEQVYGYEPFGGRAVTGHEHLLGLQAQLWTEFVDSTEKAEYMLFPRLAAFAERAWNGRLDDADDFTRRLRAQLARYEALGVQYRPETGPGPRWSSIWRGPAPTAVPTLAVSDEDIDGAP